MDQLDHHIYSGWEVRAAAGLGLAAGLLIAAGAWVVRWSLARR